jgi:hypothetical protein
MSRREQLSGLDSIRTDQMVMPLQIVKGWSNNWVSNEISDDESEDKKSNQDEDL